MIAAVLLACTPSTSSPTVRPTHTDAPPAHSAGHSAGHSECSNEGTLDGRDCLLSEPIADVCERGTCGALSTFVEGWCAQTGQRPRRASGQAHTGGRGHSGHTGPGHTGQGGAGSHSAYVYHSAGEEWTLSTCSDGVSSWIQGSLHEWCCTDADYYHGGAWEPDGTIVVWWYAPEYEQCCGDDGYAAGRFQFGALPPGVSCVNATVEEYCL